MGEPLLILGASARAAAQSAARAGYSPYAVDLFADADLAACCPAVQINDYPRELEAAARLALPSPWIYTGGLENHPALVDRIAAGRTLLGNSGDVLRKVRNPLELARVLDDAGLPHPQTSLLSLAGRRLLRKPRHSCGGVRIALMREHVSVKPDQTWYYQEFIPGESASAIYVAAESRAVLLGVSRQLVGQAWTGADGFRYCGTLGPLLLTPSRRKEYERLGACLAERFALVGLFGVDVIENEVGIWPVEVNPRYTASVEVLERGLSVEALAMHVAACLSGILPTPMSTNLAVCCGKAILYARDKVTVGATFADFVARLNEGQSWTTIADVPRVGTTIRAGHPIVTVLTTGKDLPDVERSLQRLAAETYAIV